MAHCYYDHRAVTLTPVTGDSPGGRYIFAVGPFSWGVPAPGSWGLGHRNEGHTNEYSHFGTTEPCGKYWEWPVPTVTEASAWAGLL